MATEKRRASDNPTSEIEELIKNENDPKTRAFLMVMNNINLSLIANTHTVNEIDEQLKLHLKVFNQHLAQEEEILNKGKGAWKVASWTLGIVQTIAIAFLINVTTEIKTLHQEDYDMQKEIYAIQMGIKGDK